MTTWRTAAGDIDVPVGIPSSPQAGLNRFDSLRGRAEASVVAGCSNGLALCKLHHAVFDVNIVGVRPDLVLEVRHDVLAEIDGPMLQHGLQGLQGNHLVVPHAASNRPNPTFLEERYERFPQAG